MLLWALFAAFVLRVAGQILAATVAPSWLPPMQRWYSGVMPYRYLLPAQLAIIALMAWLALGATNGTGPFEGSRAGAATWVFVAAVVYAAGMAYRLMLWLSRPPARRGVFIPIVFHFVLAAFLFGVGVELR